MREAGNSSCTTLLQAITKMPLYPSERICIVILKQNDRQTLACAVLDDIE
jgi:hypothetical protein